jgi:hypothetical protein
MVKKHNLKIINTSGLLTVDFLRMTYRAVHVAAAPLIMLSLHYLLHAE